MSTLIFRCFITGATVPYALATLQAPYEERKDSEKKPSSGVLYPEYPLCTKKLTYPRDSNRGFELVVKDPK